MTPRMPDAGDEWGEDWGEETRFEVRNQDAHMPLEQYERLPKFPVHIVLDNLRSAFNVGSVFRLADTARVESIITCGYTAHPPHPRLEKTALGSVDYVPHTHFDSTGEALASLRQREIPIWALETTSHSRSYTDVVFPKPVALLLGNEALGIDPQALEACDQIVEIPVHGFKNSLNVACACAVTVFEILRQWGTK